MASGEVETISVCGVATDVVQFRASGQVADGASELHSTAARFLFIAGNPGAIEFFVPFLRRVWELSDQQVEVCGIAHAGHSKSTATSELFSLQDQVDHKVNYLREHCCDGAPLVLAGHSIGAYVGLRVVEQLGPNEINLKRFIGLCPVVADIAKSWNARLMMFFMRHALVRHATIGATALAARLPVSLVRAIAIVGLMVEPAADAGAMNDTVNSLFEIIDPRVGRNCLHMALDEMSTVQGLDMIDSVVGNLGDKAVFVHTAVDGWQYAGKHQELRDRYPASLSHLKEEPSLRHMFSLNSWSVERMARCTWRHAADGLRDRVVAKQLSWTSVAAARIPAPLSRL